MTLKLRPYQERAVREIGRSQEIVDIKAGLGKATLSPDSVICDRCGATLETYGERCSAALDDPCPGFLAIERIRRG